MKLLGNLRQGLLFVISAPAGTGKTTLVQMLEEEFECIYRSITYTTRPKRTEEKDGISYHYLTDQEFKKKKDQGFFLEDAQVFDHHYGTGKDDINNLLKKNKHVVLIIDTQGVKHLIEQNIPLISIFISPPSHNELEQRLKKRKSENKEQQEKRLKWSEHELEMIPWYDYHIINDDLATAYNVLRSILIAEEHKAKRVGDYVFRKSDD